MVIFQFAMLNYQRVPLWESILARKFTSSMIMPEARNLHFLGKSTCHVRLPESMSTKPFLREPQLLPMAKRLHSSFLDKPISPSVENVFLYSSVGFSNILLKSNPIKSSHNFPKTSQNQIVWESNRPLFDQTSLISPSRSQEMLRHNAWSFTNGTKQFTKSNFYPQGNMVNPHFPWLTITSLLLKSSFWLVKFPIKIGKSQF